MRTATSEQMIVRLTKNSALRTGSKVGALGIAGEMRTAAIAVSTTNAISAETRRCNMGDIAL